VLVLLVLSVLGGPLPGRRRSPPARQWMHPCRRQRRHGGFGDPCGGLLLPSDEQPPRSLRSAPSSPVRVAAPGSSGRRIRCGCRMSPDRRAAGRRHLRRSRRWHGSAAVVLARRFALTRLGADGLSRRGKTILMSTASGRKWVVPQQKGGGVLSIQGSDRLGDGIEHLLPPRF